MEDLVLVPEELQKLRKYSTLLKCGHLVLLSEL